MDVKQFCFTTTSMDRNLVGGDSCDPEVEDCAGMDGMGGANCATVCPSAVDVMCMMSHPDTCLGGMFWIVVWVVILLLVICVAYRLGICGLLCGKKDD